MECLLGQLWQSETALAPQLKRHHQLQGPAARYYTMSVFGEARWWRGFLELGL